MKKPLVKIYKNSSEIAYYLRTILSQIDISDYFHLALSGGNTPKKIFSYLAETSSPIIPWNKIRFYWGDERCVPANHPESNYLMAKSTLLDKIETFNENVFRIKGENDPLIEKERYARLILSKTEGIFDLVLLGLGTDGHTASIFPDQIQVLTSKNVCEEVKHPESGQHRITLTGKTINDSKKIIFIVTGSNKSSLVYDILHKSGQWGKYPASYIYPNSGELIWILDEEAAADL